MAKIALQLRLEEETHKKILVGCTVSDFVRGMVHNGDRRCGICHKKRSRGSVYSVRCFYYPGTVEKSDRQVHRD